MGSGSQFSYVYNPTNAGWTFNGQSGISGNGSGFTGGNTNAPEGNQVAFLQIQGSFSQAISGFQAGIYTFQFDAAQRAAGDANSGPDLQNFQVLVDNTPLYGANGLTPVGTSYQLYTTSPISLSAGSHTLTFQGLDTAYIGTGRTSDNSVFIDAVSVKPAPVPEASTTVSFGLLLALGLGGMVVAARRKKRVD